MSHFLDRSFDNKLMQNILTNLYIIDKGLLISFTKLQDELKALEFYPHVSNDLPPHPANNPFIGVEIELENLIFTDNYVGLLRAITGDFTEEDAQNLALKEFGSFFKLVEDHSLRNNGYEFVSRFGLTKQQLDLVLPLVFRCLKKPPQNSARTSLHVHYNMVNFSVREVKLILFWYLLLEEVFYALSGRRVDNIFCVPYYKCPQIGYLQEILTTESEDNFKLAWHHANKYAGLNLKSVENFGTFEFRHHEGVTHPEQIKVWINFIHNFIREAVKGESLGSEFDKVYTAYQQNQLVDFVMEKFNESLNFRYIPPLSDRFEAMMTDIFYKRDISAFDDDYAEVVKKGAVKKSKGSFKSSAIDPPPSPQILSFHF